MREGDPADAAHLILSGHLGIRATLPSGEEGTIGIRRKGEVVGEMALIGGASSLRSATVLALVPSETLTLHRAAFDRLRQQDPAVNEWLLVLLADRLRETSTQLMDALYEPADVRVLRRLIEAADAFGDAVPLTQDDLATMAGTTRPTANRALRRAQDKGALRMSRGKVQLADVAALRRMAHLSGRP